jgi:hypothetical protein
MLPRARTPAQPTDFARQLLSLAGAELVADASGALWWPAERLLLVADLHLEKGSSFAARGWLLPPYDTHATLARLEQVVGAYRPRTVVCLGDSLHDRRAADRLPSDIRHRLTVLQRCRAWIWLTGNHDPDVPLPGDVQATVTIAGIVLRHEPEPTPGIAEIAGHLHPAARLVASGSSLRRPCFAADANRLVLPAFGAFTGGLNILDEAFHPLFVDGPAHVLMLGRDGVYPVPHSSLEPD